MSDPFSLAAIQPLVSHQRASGRNLIVTFTCPQTGRHVNAQWRAPQAGATSHVARQVKSTAWYEVRRQVNVMLRSVLGHGSMSRIATQAVNTAMNTAPVGGSGPATLSGSEQQQGLVEAFRTVSGQFAWTGTRWLHASAAPESQSAFDRQLQQAPVASNYDRQITARMLLEVAGAHGGVSAEEQSFLADVLDPELGSLESLSRRPPLTAAELAETTPGEGRVSMLQVAWSLALCDERLAIEEADRIETLADGLGLSRDQRRQARDAARGWLLDQALERMFSWGGHDATARQHLYALGERMGMSREEVQRAEARFQKRRAG